LTAIFENTYRFFNPRVKLEPTLACRPGHWTNLSGVVTRWTSNLGDGWFGSKNNISNIHAGENKKKKKATSMGICMLCSQSLEDN
jgi:hypothetical protein